MEGRRAGKVVQQDGNISILSLSPRQCGVLIRMFAGGGPWLHLYAADQSIEYISLIAPFHRLSHSDCGLLVFCSQIAFGVKLGLITDGDWNNGDLLGDAPEHVAKRLKVDEGVEREAIRKMRNRLAPRERAKAKKGGGTRVWRPGARRPAACAGWAGPPWGTCALQM